MTEHTVFLAAQPTWRRLGRWAAGMALAATLAACGGGSDTADATGCTKTFVDSFGNTVTCDEMRTLPGTDFAGGDAGAGDAGADGTGADGAPIANATIRITDADGKVITTTTNGEGYFRVNIGGMKQPLVASVQRSGNAWRSAMVEVIEPGRSQFYTLNLTGLTDLVLSELAKTAGVPGGADGVTPSVLSANSSRLGAAIEAVNQQIASQLSSVGLSASSFNPFTAAFRANSTGYDKVLDSVTITKTSGGTTTIDTSGGGGSTLTGQWEMFVTVEGQEFSAGTVDGSVVPATEVLAATDYNVVLSSAGGTYTSEGYTVTVNGNSVTTVGPNVNLTTVINSFTVTSYSGCGSCGVGSAVAFAYTYDYTLSGTAEGQSFNNLNLAGSAQVRYVRRS
jgi:hypothetical protein